MICAQRWFATTSVAWKLTTSKAKLHRESPRQNLSPLPAWSFATHRACNNNRISDTFTCPVHDSKNRRKARFVNNLRHFPLHCKLKESNVCSIVTAGAAEQVMKKKQMAIKVSIVEDSRGTRESLSELLGRAEAMHCVGAHPDGEEALQQIPREQPDVVLMDINLPNMSGIECVAQLKKALPKTQVLMLTT